MRYAAAGAIAQQELVLPLQKSPAGSQPCTEVPRDDGGTTSAGIGGCFRVWQHWRSTHAEEENGLPGPDGSDRGG